MKDDLDMMFSRKEIDIERISEKYPAAGRKEKEKIYKLSQQKYRQLKAKEESEDGFTVEASGVERYRRPMLYRGISAVAATLVLVSGLAGGLLLAKNSRIPNVDMTKSNDTGQSTMVTDAAFGEIDAQVNVLVDNFSHIMGELYTDEADYEKGAFLTFYQDAVDTSTGEMYKRNIDYFIVTDEKLDTSEKLKSIMDATFAPKLKAYYFGSDISGYENGTDFGDDGQVSRYIRPFVLYKDMVLSDHADDGRSFDYKFGEVYDFGEYKLISSDYSGDPESFSGRFELETAYSVYDESYMKSIVCSRVYQRDDGVLIYADLLLKSEDTEWKIANYSIMDENEKKLEESRKETEAQPTNAYESDDNAEFAELQNHELTICSNVEEAIALTSQLDTEMYDGTYPFKKVDTEKYAQQIMNAGSDTALNDIENKCYIYHIMLNSFRYFDTADVEFSSEGVRVDGSKWNAESHCLADNRNNYFYMDNEYTNGDYIDNMAFYQENNSWLHVDNIKKTFSTVEADIYDYNYIYLPDNYRYIYFYNDETGAVEEFRNYRDLPVGGHCEDTLYPDVRYMTDFTNWYIEDVEEIFGRDCAVISVETAYNSYEMHIDLRNGIVLRYTNKNNIDNTSEVMNAVSYKVDEPLEYKHFDPTGYEDESNVTPYDE